MPVADTLGGVGFLPPNLAALLRELRAPTARQVLIRGFGSACATDDHVLRDWITGIFRGHFLVIRVCELCEAAEVRDRTVSVIPTARGRIKSTPDKLLGWYSGARRNQRVYT